MLASFFGLGMGALARRTPVIAIFTATYLGIVVIWPFAPARFTWGVWPVVGIVFTLALVSVWEWRGEHGGDHPRLRRLLRPLALVAFAGITVGYAGYNYLGVTRDWWTVVQSSVANRARPLGEWITANTDTSAVLATDDDALLYLYTGRHTIPNGAFTPQEHITPQTPAFAMQALRTILATHEVDFVLASTNYGTYAVRGLVEQNPPQLRVVGALQTGRVFAPITRGRAE